MSTSRLRLAFPLLAFAFASAGQGADAPDPSWGKAADNKIFAQALVNDTMSAHPELVVMGLHAVAPGQKDEKMIASNLDRIGKKDDDDDIAVATEGKTILAPNLKEPNKFEVQVPLLDSSGRTVGSIGFVFRYHAGDDQIEFHRRAFAIRADLAKRISDHDALFAPAS